jgi:hypothetical protein
MAVPLRRRLACSLRASGVAWLVSGATFALAVKSPETRNGWLTTVSAWSIWGTAFFVLGWIVVGLPIIALGERVLRMNALLLALVTGAGGALVMELPFLITKAITASDSFRWSWSVRELFWPSVAFAIAAFAGWLYRRLLKNESFPLRTARQRPL